METDMPILCARCRGAPAEVAVAQGRLRLCPDCFIEFFEGRLMKTVQEFKMFRPDEELAVAVSGGKDSGALLHALRRVYPNLELIALHINLGIRGYSDHCEEKVRRLAEGEGAELRVLRLREMGFTIDDFLKTSYRRRVCSPCGVIKRHLLDSMALEAGLKTLATGHNLDDVVSTLLETFFAGDLVQLIRLKPVLQPRHPKQTRKIKPLVGLSEFEDYMYALYTEIPIRSESCPHSPKTKKGRDLLEALGKGHPGFKYQALSLFVKKLIPLLEREVSQPELRTCSRCGFPSSEDICAYCRRIELVTRGDEAAGASTRS